MKLRSERIFEPATPEYVLSVIRDSHRQQCQWDPGANPGVSLTFDSTIAQWREAADLLPWRGLAKAIAQWFDVELPKKEWRALLEPSKERCLEGLCEAIAQRASRERIVPKNILGAQCRTASIFLKIRELLEQAGADVSGLKPDTSLAEFTRRYPQVFLDRLGRLFPGRLPDVRISTPLENAGLLLCGISVLAFAVGEIVGLRPLVTAAVATFVVSMLVGLVARRVELRSVDFGSLETFRDLVNVLSENK